MNRVSASQNPHFIFYPRIYKHCDLAVWLGDLSPPNIEIETEIRLSLKPLISTLHPPSALILKYAHIPLTDLTDFGLAEIDRSGVAFGCR